MHLSYVQEMVRTHKEYTIQNGGGGGGGGVLSIMHGRSVFTTIVTTGYMCLTDCIGVMSAEADSQGGKYGGCVRAGQHARGRTSRPQQMLSHTKE